jgi:predicted GNAT family acetyltransferase
MQVVHPEFDTWHRVRVTMLRELVQAGAGTYKYLRDNAGEAVAAAGVFMKSGVGRYADVMTVAQRRGTGCASFLLTNLLIELRQTPREVVIVADVGSAAERLYRHLGFEPFISIRYAEW